MYLGMETLARTATLAVAVIVCIGIISVVMIEIHLSDVMEVRIVCYSVHCTTLDIH